MLSTISTAIITGIECARIDIETDITTGFPSFSIVGLADTAVKEAKERVRSAIRSCGFQFPYNHRIVVNLAPSDVHKSGSAFDLPMALGILVSSGAFNAAISNTLVFGEVGLDGSVRFCSGVLPRVLFAKQAGFNHVILPRDNIAEATLVAGIDIIGVTTLKEAVRHLNGEKIIAPSLPAPFGAQQQRYNGEYDMKFIRGQYHAKRALEIAAAGGHNVLLCGAPGSGKTMLAKSIVSILPHLTHDECIEVMRVYSVAGLLEKKHPLMTQRPFRAPHHSASYTALVGGGNVPRPGEVSLAHNGVLFLDEIAEFPRQALETLRQPLEDGQVTVSRARGSMTYPARCMLIAAHNPCPCGYARDEKKECSCSMQQILAYTKRLSGPLLDRIDLTVDVPRLHVEELSKTPLDCEQSETIRARVEATRAAQYGRQKRVNAALTHSMLSRYCKLNATARGTLLKAVDHFVLSPRAYYRVLKVARTIADLAGSSDIHETHIAEALQYRQKI